MRLISQDGKGDMPYENFIFRACGGDIVASRDILTNEKQIVARYSTESKALKVMEMLRNSYCGLPIIMKNVDISDGVIELLKDLKKNGIIFQKPEENPSIEYVDNTYFKFPDDSEIEV